MCLQQPSRIAPSQAHAGLLLLGAVCRATRRIDEYSLLTVLSGAAFISSSECPVRYAEDIDFNPAAYVLAVMAVAALLWAWVSHLAFSVAAPAAAAAVPAGRRLQKMHGRRFEYDAAGVREDAPVDDV